ncbi:hypothetical protein AN639_11680 [Candidatus Epulonipiscium fishelsonii]|uniref:Uncharacterized protein n=1 Tax=Candidatus Epulonipiscium fishelsonii TaxID=77094 RepID=A0ACC8XG74_9FIRM|nr:hypothetical protein AN396_01785 [Epulopiscium sp. SCG-B11WGA-EpuloA1]ONI42971.1 hypothetical protein AN639_11680 [Epulopiscium sp. SCG-B05WGA-EpuloA1]
MHIRKEIKNHSGTIGYELSDGTQVNVEETINLAKNNLLNNIVVDQDNVGNDYIYSANNEVDSLPIITQVNWD